MSPAPTEAWTSTRCRATTTSPASTTKTAGGSSTTPVGPIQRRITRYARVRPCPTPKSRSSRSSTRWPTTMPELREIFARLHGVAAEHRLAVLALAELRGGVRSGHVHLPPQWLSESFRNRDGGHLIRCSLSDQAYHLS